MMPEQSMQEQSSPQAQPRKVLKIENLAKTYDKRQVVRDVSFQLTSGQIVGLLGPNGAGKTTSFYMLVGLVQMDHGRIFLDNKDLSPLAMHERARRGIGYLPQEPSIFRKLSIADNIMAILETRSDLTKAQKNTKLEALLEEFHITHIRNSLGILEVNVAARRLRARWP
jgi:lipopolysaccharide export system ATP-binding protein